MIFFAGRISKKPKDGFYAYLILGKTFFFEKKLKIMELKAVFKIFLRPGTIKNLHLGSLYRLESPQNQNSKVGRKSGFGSKGLKKSICIVEHTLKVADTNTTKFFSKKNKYNRKGTQIVFTKHSSAIFPIFFFSFERKKRKKKKTKISGAHSEGGYTNTTKFLIKEWCSGVHPRVSALIQGWL